MTADKFKEKFIVKFKMDTKSVIAYINKLEKELEKLKGSIDES